MKRIITLLVAVVSILMANAKTFSYRFNSTSLPKAIQKIIEEYPDLDINFIYNELENYRTSSTVNADNPYEALRQLIGLNPVTVTRSKNTYYVEALQHGKYIYTGKAIGYDNEPVIAATIMLLAPKDSTVLTYGITDGAGRFSIPCDRQSVIAKLSCVGYKTTYKKFDSFNVGIVHMHELPIQLKAVTVEGENSSLLSDRSIYRPTPRQKNASQTAIDLLRNLAIPQLNVNLVDESVTTLTGSAVAIYVNGLPASSEELQGLRTADIKTVEYLDFPIDPRFSGNEHIINFVMQKYEYGGYTKFSISENALVGLSSRASVYSKFTYKSMIFDFYTGASNLNIHNGGTSRIGKYTLKDADGKESVITRNEESDKSHFRYNQYPVTFRAVYDSDKIQIGNTVGVNFDQSPIAESQGTLTFSSDKHTGYIYQNNQPYTTCHFIWAGTYYFILPNEFQLSLTPRANYGHTDYSYFYTTSLQGNESIDNTSREDYYQISGGASLYKGFSQNHSATANIYAGSNRNEVSYTGSSPYENTFSDSFAGIRIGYNYNNRRWRVSSNVALQWERNGINDEYISEIYPLINVSGSYSPSNHHSLQTFFHYGANYPGESVKTPNVLQDNELMYKTGNPDLPLSRQITFNLQYNWVANNTFSLSLYSQYFGEYNLYVPIFESYKNGTAILKTYSSEQDYNRTQLGLSFNLKLLDGTLQLAAQPSISIFRYKGYYDMKKNPFIVNASATYYIKQFFLQASFQSANKTIQGNQGVWYRTRDFYQLQVGWGNSNWNIRLSAINMFRGDWLA
ncbi:MAG: outer membrane beta-barrel family protein, partial [Muribaculaceae bacterium]|nr:outer membrane beta-barrel family protein [Muribaculaceae bacterium]